MLSAEWMSAEECVEAGLALEALAPDELMPRAMDRARTLAALPMASLAKTKELIMEPVRPQLRAAVHAENKGLAELSDGPANREALAAFREKREANFSDLGL